MEKKLIRLACIPVYAIYLWIIISQTMQSVRMESEGGEANEPYRSVTNLAEAIILVGFALLIYLNLFRDQKRMVSFNCFVAAATLIALPGATWWIPFLLLAGGMATLLIQLWRSEHLKK